MNDVMNMMINANVTLLSDYLVFAVVYCFIVYSLV
jgi:hypothetical protein